MNCIRPLNNKSFPLPYNVTCIGSQDYQCHINRPEGYPTHQFIFSRKGNGTLIVDGITYVINEGDIFYLAPFTPHTYYSECDAWGTMWLHFMGFAVRQTLDVLSLNTPIVFTDLLTSSIDDILFDLTSTLKANTYENQIKASGLFYQLLMEIHQSIELKKNAKYSDEYLTFNESLDYIEANFTSAIQLNDLAEISKVTPQHYCKLFKDQFHQRPIEYINNRRLQEAKRLLLETNEPIKVIAKEIGFEDSSYFGAQFKRQVGITASQYRGGRRSNS